MILNFSPNLIMSQTQTETKPTHWMRIAAAILIPLFTVWYVDRENRINDLKESNNYLRQENRELKAEGIRKDGVIEHWIDENIKCERQIPQLLDSLKLKIKHQSND